MELAGDVEEKKSISGWENSLSKDPKVRKKNDSWETRSPKYR